MMMALSGGFSVVMDEAVACAPPRGAAFGTRNPSRRYDVVAR